MDEKDVAERVIEHHLIPANSGWSFLPRYSPKWKSKAEGPFLGHKTKKKMWYSPPERKNGCLRANTALLLRRP